MLDNLLDWIEANYMKATIAIVAIMLLMIFGVVAALAATATVTWQHPTQCTDNTALPLAQIESTRIEYGTCSGTAFGTKSGETVVPAPATTATISGLTATTLCFRAFAKALATSTCPGESGPSNVVSKVFTPPVPKPPTLATVAQTVFDIRWLNGKPILGRNVGTIAKGQPCSKELFIASGAAYDYYKVSLADVKLWRDPRSARVVAKCAAT